MNRVANHTPFVGYWRLVHMDEWDQAYLDLVEEAYIEFDDNGQGGFVFGVVKGWLDCRFSKYENQPRVEFSWEGESELDPICGRGWAVLDSPKEISGQLFIHNSDDSYFEAHKL